MISLLSQLIYSIFLAIITGSRLAIGLKLVHLRLILGTKKNSVLEVHAHTHTSYWTSSPLLVYNYEEKHSWDAVNPWKAEEREKKFYFC